MLAQLVLVLLVGYLMSGLSFSTLICVIGIFFISYGYNLYSSQDQILYQNQRSKQQPPNPPFMRSPAEYQLQFQKLFIKTVDAKLVSALYVPAHKLSEEGPVPIISTSVAQHVANSIKQYDHAKSGSEGSQSDCEDSDIIDFVTPAAKQAATPIIDTNYLFSSPHLDSISQLSTYNLFELVSNKDHHVQHEIPTIIWAHGNAGDINARLPHLYYLATALGCNVLIYDYRGYGDSTDVQPTEEGLILDAISTYLASLHRPDINHKLIYLYGQSLGGAVSIALTCAVEIAQQKKKDADKSDLIANAQLPPQKVEIKPGEKEVNLLDIIAPMLFNAPLPKGLIVENTFTSIAGLVDIFFPFISPFKSILLRLSWESLQRVKSHITNTPVLFLSSTQDEIIPNTMMKKLYDTVPHSNKKIYQISNGHHNDAWVVGGSRYILEIQKFLQNASADMPVSNSSKPEEQRNVIFEPSEEQMQLSLTRLNDILLKLSQSMQQTMSPL